MRSTSVVPLRGMPITKMGSRLGQPDANASGTGKAASSAPNSSSSRALV